MAPKPLFLCTLLTFSLTFARISSAGLKYEVINEVPKTPGGIKFTEKIGIPYTKELLPTLTNFIWSTILQQSSTSDRKPMDTIQVYIRESTDAAGIKWGQSKINVSSNYLDIVQGDLKWDFTSVMYHEMTHVLQWDAEGKTPVNLVEGIADFTRIKANYMPPSFAKPGDGDKWDQGYAFTARFLEYCDGLFPGFVAKLNNKMRKTYDVSYFKELSGKPVEQLWKEYKTKHGKRN
uniref:uncharacterized protein LOC122597574 n=1 Tax=Erigeron canadensis TaxID=72917 RepID=UPI001CB8B2FC|nr:uncharacterized protein LOC122597574 [Erigeron canadensis]